MRRSIPQSVPIGASLYRIILRKGWMGHPALVDRKFDVSGAGAQYGLFWRTAAACWGSSDSEQSWNVRRESAFTDRAMQTDVST